MSLSRSRTLLPLSRYYLTINNITSVV